MLYQAWRHVQDKTLADATLEEFRAVMATEAVRKVEARIDKVVPTGDVLAVDKALQAWNRTMKTELRTLREETSHAPTTP